MTRYVLADGDTTDNGFGLSVDEFWGLRRVQHGGADIATRSQLVFLLKLPPPTRQARFYPVDFDPEIVDAFAGDRCDLAPRRLRVFPPTDGT